MLSQAPRSIAGWTRTQVLLLVPAIVVSIAICGCNRPIEHTVTLEKSDLAAIESFPELELQELEFETEELEDESKMEPNVSGLEVEKVTIGSIRWFVDYNTAMLEAKRENKPVWLHFGENPG